MTPEQIAFERELALYEDALFSYADFPPIKAQPFGGDTGTDADFCFAESTFEEQYENEQFAQDGDFENMDASEIM